MLPVPSSSSGRYRKPDSLIQTETLHLCLRLWEMRVNITYGSCQAVLRNQASKADKYTIAYHL